MQKRFGNAGAFEPSNGRTDMTDDKNKVDSQLITGQESLRVFEGLNRGMSRRDALRMLGVAGIAAAGAGSLFGSAGQVFAATSASTGQGKQGGRIKVATSTSSTADTLDPAKGANYTDYCRHNMFYNGLAVLDAQLTPRMALAESFDTDDAISWTIKLRKDVVFHDGRPFTSADVVYSLNRHKLPETGSRVVAIAQQLEEVKAVGPHEVQIRLVSPNADLPAILATTYFLIVRDGTNDFAIANGTGPFKCAEFQPGVRSISARNASYWKPGLPYLDEIEFFSIPDEAARISALLAGDVDLINPINPRSVARIQESAKVELMETPTGGYTNLGLRDNLGPVQNPDFVLAMKYLQDRKQINRVAFRGYGVIANDQPVAPSNRYYFAGLPQREYDLDKARFHLQKSGMAGRPLPLVCSDAATGSVDIAQLLQLSGQQIGLKLDIKRMPADGYWSSHWMKHPLYFGNIGARPTVDLMFSLFYQSSAGMNESGWKNEQFDQLLVAARGETDDAKRKQMYGDMQVLVNEHCGVGIAQFNSSLDGHSVKLKGLTPHPLGGMMGYMFAENVWLDA
ncbi:Extracellular solute-binding protein [Pseudomonas coronafaciens pv. garcae]|uniref:Extracellular solute-binding protein n=2 Tax=Pseudomonas syringae group TaxID=136849 RepID=A0AB37QPE2_9PSED|nr:Extracellular solute-binding protein [Pseudomonas coronafaciens pv. garcae]RMS01482.1 Extracellular solute-binding protein [Pseudomonas coronafaciens pv. garcae]RMV10578.1 Extracellular solute-binding protein [Pseudomonas coronafaciens pv. coronafaciens]